MKILELLKAVVDKHDIKQVETKQRRPPRTGGWFSSAKLWLASNPRTSAKSLDKLADKDSPELLERIAENPHTRPATLEKLAFHEAPEVRSAIVENENTPIEIIQALSFDDNGDVRFKLAENPHSPIEVLETLTHDENPYVAGRARQTLSNLENEK